MNKAIFLDRDGTINVDYGYVYKEEKLKFVPGVIEALKELQQMGYLLIIVTNQSGIGRGYFSEKEYYEFERCLTDKLNKKGVVIQRTYFCPHCDEDNCSCRKPKLALFEKAALDYDLDWDKCYAIGDKKRDLALTEFYPVEGILFSQEKDVKYPSFATWEEIVRYIIKKELK